MQRPLADDVARPARAYLAALVAPDEVSDAWHELVDDVSYWGDRDLLPVLRLAHQVVLQHQRVAPEVAALALVDVGVDAPADVAVVLGADEDAARDWTRTAVAVRDGVEPASGRLADTAATPRTAPASTTSASTTPASATAPTSTAAAAPTQAPDAAVEPEGSPAGRAVRIGFDEDGPLPSFDDDGGPRWTTRRILVAALALWVLVALVWLLLR